MRVSSTSKRIQIDTFITFCILNKPNKPNKPRNETAPCHAVELKLAVPREYERF